jgi:hypothetical protein
MMRRRSIENDSAIVMTQPYPRAAQTIAVAIPVFPDVASTMVSPGFSKPSFSA